MINSVYGKAMENLRRRMNVRLVNNEKVFLKYNIRRIYSGYKKFDKDYAAIHEIEPVLILNKPIYLGCTVLYLSKWKMCEKFFDAELLFTDTPYLWNKIKKFYKWKDLFDFSNYSKNSSFFNQTNKKVISKMKDELGEVIIIEFVGLK